MKRSIKYLRVDKAESVWPDQDDNVPEFDAEVPDPKHLLDTILQRKDCSGAREVYLQTLRADGSGHRWKNVDDVDASELPRGPEILRVKVVVSSAAPTAAGTPVFYRNVILTLPKMDDGSPEVITKFEKVTQTTLRKVLDRQGCDVVQDPVSKEWVDFELLNLQDNMLLIAQRVSTPMDNRVSTIEGFVQSSVRGFEADAAEAMYRDMQQHHNSVEVLEIRSITSAAGRKREVDGVVLAADCAAILEAKQVLDYGAVQQLESCLECIKTQKLSGLATKLKGKELVGYVAGRTIVSDPNKANELVKSCKQKGYGILVASGKGLSLGNSRLPRVDVKCTLHRNICGGLRSTVRTLL